jgi:HD-GYP domain-containing protein (c-di-GMP phosphodiesterase class II)
MAIKQIPIDMLSVGMFIVELDRPWPEHPRLRLRSLIEYQEDIDFLEELGVLQVIIDPTLGKDVPKGQHDPEQHEPEQQKETRSLTEELMIARTVRNEALTALQGIFEGVKTGAPIDNTTAKKTVHTLMDTILRRHDSLVSLIHMQQFNANMFTHAINVCAFALVVGKFQGYEKPRLEQLGAGAMLHDVGELRLPRNLLRKAEAYTDQERRLLHQHPRLGVAIMSKSNDMHEESLRIILEHHERIDGSGYPAGLKGLQISPLSEIVSIVDTYDGMLSDRQGRPPLTPARAIKEIYQQGLKGHFDPRWVERLICCLGIYPVGSLVELSTGELAVVTEANPVDALRPSVQIIWDSTKQLYPAPKVVNLAAPKMHEPERNILRALDPAKENLSIAAYLAESN